MPKLAVPLLLALALGCHEIHLDYGNPGGEIRLFDDLYSVSVVDEDNAVAVGYYGAVYFTEDGGQTWQQGTTDTIKSLYSVSMADAKRGWAVGQLGLILRTEDGGQTWTRQPNLKEKEGSHLFGVTAIDEDRAWAAGAWGTRIFTTDGGATWSDNSFTIDEYHPQFVWLTPKEQERVRKGEKVYEDVTVNDVFCLPAPSQLCWLVGEFGYIYRSEDAGTTWTPATIEGSVEMEPIEIGYNELAVPEQYLPGLKEFADAVAAETHLNVAIAPLASEQEIQDFGLGDDPNELFEILEARAQEVRSLLEGLGVNTDRIRMRGQPPWDYEDYLEDDPEFLVRYFTGRRSESGGVAVRVIQNPILFTVRFRDEKSGMIAGLGGVVLTSSDGGRSWIYGTTDRKQALFSVGGIDSRALAIGEKGFIQVSLDQGDTWSAPDAGTFPEIFTYLRDVDFGPSGRVGLMVGQSGQILRSTDRGYRWTQVLPPQDRQDTAS